MHLEHKASRLLQCSNFCRTASLPLYVSACLSLHHQSLPPSNPVCLSVILSWFLSISAKHRRPLSLCLLCPPIFLPFLSQSPSLSYYTYIYICTNIYIPLSVSLSLSVSSLYSPYLNILSITMSNCITEP
jgi:hypothetical protein